MSGPQTHSRLGGSVAKQFMTCPGSVRMRRELPEPPSSEAADEGTRLHALMEHCLKSGDYSAAEFLGGWLEGEEQIPHSGGFSSLNAVPGFTREQIDAVNVVLRHVEKLMAEPGAELFVETSFSLADIREGMFGTCDILVRTLAALYVIDAKFGKGVAVEVAGNPQPRYYGAGARRHFGAECPDRIVLTIVQPRRPHPDGPVRSEEIDLFDLMAWEAELAEAVARTDDPNAPLVAGEHCRFCPGARIGPDGRYPCAAFQGTLDSARDAAFAIVADPPKMAEMDAAELGRRLSELAVLAKYIENFKAYAKHRAREIVPEGFAWAPGGRELSWNKPAGEVLAVVRAFHGEEAGNAIAKIVTPIQAEKALDAAAFADIAAFIDKGTSAPMLVKKGARKTHLTLAEVQAHYAENRDDAFSEVE